MREMRHSPGAGYFGTSVLVGMAAMVSCHILGVVHILEEVDMIAAEDREDVHIAEQAVERIEDMLPVVDIHLYHCH